MVLTASLWIRALEAQSHIFWDLEHFYQFAETLFTADHFNYYASVVNQTYTYAHLPLFPLLLAPVQRLYGAIGWEPVIAVKTLVYIFDVATAVLLFMLARCNRLSLASALFIASFWLLSPWLFEASALNGHVTSVAAFFLTAALLRRSVPWQAGALLALAVATRSEFLMAAFALAGLYARSGVRPAAGYLSGFGVVIGLIVGPFLVRHPAGLYWSVVGHLQGRGEGLPVMRAFIEAATGAFPDELAGPQTWAMPVALIASFAIGWFVSDPRTAVFKASLAYALALTVGHGRYFVLPVVAGLACVARPGIWGWPLAIYVFEFFIPMNIQPRWIIRALAIAFFFAWPLLRLLPGLRSFCSKPLRRLVA